jgi:hypothetical protein
MRDRPLPAWQRRSALAAEEADYSGLAGKPAFVASERPFCRHESLAISGWQWDRDRAIVLGEDEQHMFVTFKLAHLSPP